MFSKAFNLVGSALVLALKYSPPSFASGWYKLYSLIFIEALKRRDVVHDHVVASLNSLNGLARNSEHRFDVVLAEAEELSGDPQDRAWRFDIRDISFGHGSKIITDASDEALLARIRVLITRSGNVSFVAYRRT